MSKEEQLIPKVEQVLLAYWPELQTLIENLAPGKVFNFVTLVWGKGTLTNGPVYDLYALDNQSRNYVIQIVHRNQMLEHCPQITTRLDQMLKVKTPVYDEGPMGALHQASVAQPSYHEIAIAMARVRSDED